MEARLVRPWAKAVTVTGSMLWRAAQRAQTRAMAAVESTGTPSMAITRARQTLGGRGERCSVGQRLCAVLFAKRGVRLGSTVRPKPRTLKNAGCGTRHL